MSSAAIFGVYSLDSMNAQQELAQTMKLLRESSMLSALAYGAIHGEKSDDVSQNEAFQTYGKAWIKDRLLHGLLHTTRVGKGDNAAILFSRYEIETLKRSEKYVTEMYEALTRENNQ